MLLRRIMWYLGSIHCGMLYVWLISFHCWLHARAALLSGTCQLLRLVHDTQLDCLFWMFFINSACFHRKPLLNWHWLSWNIYSWLLNALNNNLDHQTQTSHQPSTNNVLLIRTSRQISCNSWLIIPHDNSWKKTVHTSSCLVLTVCPQSHMKLAPVLKQGRWQHGHTYPWQLRFN